MGNNFRPWEEPKVQVSRSSGWPECDGNTLVPYEAPAERTCRVASRAPRTAVSLYIHRCGSIRRENASHDHFHLSPCTVDIAHCLHGGDGTWLNCTGRYYLTRSTGYNPSWSIWVVGTCIVGLQHFTQAQVAQAARPDRPRRPRKPLEQPSLPTAALRQSAALCSCWQ